MKGSTGCAHASQRPRRPPGCGRRRRLPNGVTAIDHHL